VNGLRLDHISYATTQLNLLCEVQRMGSLIGSSFIDGGVHPRFGTRNFILPLLNDRYIEVVCPLEHPSTENSYFGKMVTKRASEGSGWMTWVVSVEDISFIETKLGRKSIEGTRRYPDGKEIKWR